MKTRPRIHLLVLTLAVILASLAACSSPNDLARQASVTANNSFAPYQIKNFIEQKYYSWRLQMSDDPSMIVWCTIFPPTPGTKPMTVPIVGKLVSSSKRPYSSSTTNETVDAQGMYGSSTEYRYGFGPTGIMEYYDITNLSTVCTTMPLLWQTQLTVMVQSKDNTLLQASQQAHDLLAKGQGAEAAKILDAAMQKAQGGQ